MTEREISTMMVRTLGRKAEDLEARLRRRVSYAYTERERRRDVVALVRVHATIDEHRGFLRDMDAAERARRAA